MNGITYMIYLFIMASVTYLIRALPLVCCKGRIKNRFFQSFLAYVPYSVLAAMTVPAIFYSSEHVIASALGFVVAVAFAYYEKGLMKVACATCATIFIVECVISYIK